MRKNARICSHNRSDFLNRRLRRSATLWLLLVSALLPATGKSQCTLKDSLQRINYNSFIGRPVINLLAALPSTYTHAKVRGGSRFNIANALHVDYNGKLAVIIYVREFNHINRVSQNGTWDLNLFKRENIDFVVVVEDGRCIVNCGNANYLFSTQ